jgi:hypothetical protein
MTVDTQAAELAQPERGEIAVAPYERAFHG